ncbi:glycosyltransferase family 4 protein [Alkalicoccus saliphilus]|uniref:Uncharacterized protein n=1 Tax=Alkalicoccus saliphilus TaxID=200989 RepID=A0A2T4U2Z5_9BACI|nr:glycosyltransferase family 4 protein [Alkalicoccus saliphilus]PTL37773.1 hypothetical protein C6Y45_14790 [Alkalicoccus saliphilus]
MKIYYVSASKVPSRDANSVQVMKMCQALARQSHEVTLFARNNREEGVSYEYDYYSVEKIFTLHKIDWPQMRFVGGWVYGSKVKKAAGRDLPDLFYGRDKYSLYHIRSLGVPFAYESHVLPGNKIHRYLEGRMFSSPNFVKLIVTAQALKREYLQIYPDLEESKVQVVHNGADKRPLEEKASAGENDGEKLKIGYVGHLYKGKGMEIIHKLAERLDSGYEFHIVGGREEDIQYWKDQTRDLNIIYHGFVSQGELPGYYKKFDVMLAPYQDQRIKTKHGTIDKWPSPLKVIEYMSYGRAIVSSDLPMTREVLVHRKNSLLCSPEKIDDWVESIRLLREEPTLRRRLAAQAMQEFQELYSWESRAAIVLDHVQ